MIQDSEGRRVATGMSRRDVLRGAVYTGSLIGAGLLLAACTPGTNASTASGTPRRGGTLHVGVAGGGSGDTVDVFINNTQADGARIAALYDQLTQIDTTLQYTLALAESVESDATGQLWTVRVKDGIEFHNGKTLDADDVIFSLQRLFDPSLAAYGALQLGPIDYKNLVKVDARTIQVPMTSPFSTFDIALGDGRLTGIVPVGYDPANPVGTGPFQFKSFTPGEESVFERFPNYWGTPANLDTLILTDITDDNARVNALISGQVDAITGVPYSLADSFAQQPSLKLLESPSGSFQPIMMKSDSGPFADARMRQALRLVVDRQQAVDVALHGHGTPASDVYSPYDPAFDSTLVRQRDVEQAKKLLAEAGYDGSTIELTTSPIWSGLTEACSVIVQNAADAGLNLTVQEVDPATLFGTGFQYPLMVNIWPSVRYLTTAAVADAQPGNSEGYANPDYQALFLEAQATTDEDQRAVIQKQMQKILFDDGPYLIPYFSNTLDAYNANFGGWDEVDYTGIGMAGMFAKAYQVGG